LLKKFIKLVKGMVEVGTLASVCL